MKESQLLKEHRLRKGQDFQTAPYRHQLHMHFVTQTVFVFGTGLVNN